MLLSFKGHHLFSYIACRATETRGRNLHRNIHLLMFFPSFSVVFILATRTEVARLLLVAKKLEMLNGDFAFVTLDFYISETLRTSLSNTTWSLSWEEMLEIFEGLITLSVKKLGDKELRNITKWLNNGLQDMPLYQNNSTTPSVKIDKY